eukprot:1145823-Pelagomonas_calceolata.AAC.3
MPSGLGVLLFPSHEGLGTFLEGAAVQDGVVKTISLPLGIIFSPDDGSFKEEVFLAQSVHPGKVESGFGARWKIGPSTNARGSHAVSVELFQNTSYFAQIVYWQGQGALQNFSVGAFAL